MKKLHQMTIERVPHSSVVGSSLKIVAKDVGVVAMLVILVPQPHLDYCTVADAVAGAILDGHVSRKGATLVLPDDFVPDARRAVARRPQAKTAGEG